MTKRLVDAQHPLEPSLWNDSTFDVAVFVDHLFSVPRNFPKDYQMIYALSPTQLSTLLEAQLVRCFLMDIVLRGKRIETLGRMESGVSNLDKRSHEGGVELRQMKERMDHLKALSEEATKERNIHQIDVEGLKKLLEDTQGALLSMEERIYQLTHEVMVVSVNYFEEVKRREAFHYPQLDLSHLDPFKVVMNGELVDEE